jgi:hypothetical protein
MLVTSIFIGNECIKSFINLFIVKMAESTAQVPTPRRELQHTNSDPRRTKEPSTLASAHSIAQVPHAGNGRRLASGSRALPAQPGRFHVGVLLQRSPSTDSLSVQRPEAVARRIKKAARSTARGATGFMNLMSPARMVFQPARRLQLYLLLHRGSFSRHEAVDYEPLVSWRL